MTAENSVIWNKLTSSDFWAQMENAHVVFESRFNCAFDYKNPDTVQEEEEEGEEEEI